MSDDFIAELIGVFLEDTPSLLAGMQTALKEDDVDGVGRAAHTLYSSSGMFGAVTLQSLCRELEMGCRNGMPADAGRQAQEIAEAFESARVELEDVRREMQVGG